MSEQWEEKEEVVVCVLLNTPVCTIHAWTYTFVSTFCICIMYVIHIYWTPALRSVLFDVVVEFAVRGRDWRMMVVVVMQDEEQEEKIHNIAQLV